MSDETTELREKLEEVAWEYDASYAEPYEHGAIAEAIIELLDRQAAITERECLERASKSDWLGQHLHAVMAENRELQDKLDELNAELGGGNCARCAEDMGRYADSLCNPLKERIAELLRCLENDWHIHASWDGLRKFWCIELTEDGVKLRDATHGTLTVDQVIEAFMRHCTFYYDNKARNRDSIVAEFQAFADELNAELGSGTCKITATATNNLMYPDYMTKWYELSCGHSLTLNGDEAPKWCAVCGKAVER